MQKDSAVAVAPTNEVSIKERVKLGLKFSLVFGVFFYLYKKGLITANSFEKLFSSPKSVLFCSVLMAVNTVLGAIRWRILLRTQGAELRFVEVLKLNLIGAFFNIALPGAVSGDFVKAVHVAEKFKDKRAAVFGSMLFDRILGVSAMVFVGSFSALLSVFIPWGGALPDLLIYTVGGVGFAVIAFYLYLFLSHRKDPVFQILQFFTKRHEKLGMIDRLYHGVMGYRAYPKRVLKAIAFSMVIHMMMIIMAFVITETISPGGGLPFLPIAVVVPIGMLATAIPVLPAGVGTGHAAFYALFKMIGSDQGAEVFSLIVLYQVLAGVVGGVIYLKYLAEKKQA